MRNWLTGGSAALAAAALCACATGQGAVRTQLEATLTGHQQTPGPGDLDGTGTAQIRLDGANGRICWTLNVRGIGPATSAAIHRGAAGSTGPAVVPLTTPTAAGQSEGCATVAAGLVREMALAAHGFYLSVSDAERPAGAIRGQLRGGVIRPLPQSRPVRR